MILVTGATGFVGGALLDDLSARGRAFRAVSRTPRSGFHAVGDINDRTDWAAALKGVDSVVHLAARTHVTEETASDPEAAYRALNVDATVNLAEQAASAGVKRFVFVSSVKVNGESTPFGRPFTPEAEPAPEDSYGRSKLEAERALFALGGETGMEIVVIRPPLVYGPGVKANFASLMGLVRRGFPLPLGSVRNERSLVFVRNLTDFIILCADHPKAANEVFLVGDAEALSIGTLISKIAREGGHPLRLFPFPGKLLELAAAALGKRATMRRLIGSLTVDIGKARSLLEWTPPYSVDQGLRETLRGRRDEAAPLRMPLARTGA